MEEDLDADPGLAPVSSLRVVSVIANVSRELAYEHNG